ncbi:DNA polymerase III [Treponema sp. R80B11-R83G3]
MFENIIEQSAVLQLRDDILSKRDAPSMLFFGPSCSGKGSAALELARVLSCEEKAAWGCKCSSCERYKFLQHDDLLVLGERSFSSEILACQHAFLRNPSKAKTLFFRSLRKLQIRFSPVLLENDSKTAKAVAANLQSLDEGLNELLLVNAETVTEAALNKLCASLVKDSLALESEGINGIPINHIRSASYWCRLAPNGKRKTLIIENAETMRDDARNSLLKLLEEPPPSVSIVLTAQRREAIMQTILSRLRPYRFLKRSAESEKEVIRSVFKENSELTYPNQKGSILASYLDSFLPQSTEKLYPLAAWFIVSFARTASIYAKNKGHTPAFLIALGEQYAPVAETAGLERYSKNSAIVKAILSKSKNFEEVSFLRFMNITLELIGDCLRSSNAPEFIAYNDLIKKYVGEAVTSVDILNINAAITLENLLYKLKTAAIRGRYG